MEMVFLNVQTTGLNESDQIIDIAAVDIEGSVIFSSYCKPTIAIDPGAFYVHSISEEMLKDAPSWSDIAGQLKAVLTNKEVVGYPSYFVSGMLEQTAAAFNDADFVEFINNVKFYNCALLVNEFYDYATDHFDYFPALESALESLEINIKDCGRVAINKAVATALIYKRINQIKARTEKAREKARVWREKDSDARFALVPDNYKDYPYFGQSNRPDGYITLSKLPLKDADKYEYAGTCCSTYGDKGHLFKPKQSS